MSFLFPLIIQKRIYLKVSEHFDNNTLKVIWLSLKNVFCCVEKKCIENNGYIAYPIIHNTNIGLHFLLCIAKSVLRIMAHWEGHYSQYKGFLSDLKTYWEICFLNNRCRTYNVFWRLSLVASLFWFKLVIKICLFGCSVISL